MEEELRRQRSAVGASLAVDGVSRGVAAAAREAVLPEAEESDEAAAPAPEQRRLRGRAAAAYAAFAAVHGPPPPPPEEASADAVEEDEEGQNIPDGFRRNLLGRIVDELEIDEDERRELDRRQQQPGQRLLQMRRNFNPENVRKSAKADDTFTKRQNHVDTLARVAANCKLLTITHTHCSCKSCELRIAAAIP